ncbi:hypothetical protein GOV05_00255 [Candidatus Woesearchaeota archaeon]|nr:hypothetical protein [Candidatus Woesearchaeota archaeon]
MVSEKSKDGKTYYLCDICKLVYESKELALQCEEWCKNHPGTCNPEVAKYALNTEL